MNNDQIVALIGAMVCFRVEAAGDDFGVPIRLLPGDQARVIGLAYRDGGLAFVLANKVDSEPYTVPLEFLESASIVSAA